MNNLDNLAFERVRSQETNSRLRDEMKKALSPRMRLTLNSVKRDRKRVTRNPTGNPRKQAAMGSNRERTSIRRDAAQAYAGSTACPKRKGYKGLAIVVSTSIHPQINPADSTTLRPRKTDARNGITGALALPRPKWSVQEQAVSRKPCVGRIAQEANASGKAGGYADVGTMVWKVEE